MRNQGTRVVKPDEYVAPGETVYVEGTGMLYHRAFGDTFLGFRKTIETPNSIQDEEDTLP